MSQSVEVQEILSQQQTKTAMKVLIKEAEPQRWRKWSLEQVLAGKV